MICNLSQLPCTGHGSGSDSDSEDTDIIGHRDSSLACRPRRARHKIQFPKQSWVKDVLGRTGQSRAHWHAGRKRHHRARHRHHCQWVSQAGWQFAIKLADWRFKVRAVQPSQGLSESPRCLLLIAIYQAHSMLYMLREKERDGERGKGCGGCFKSHVTVWTPVFRCSNAPQGVRLSCVIILI